jgi:hypothetical protein
LLIDTSANRVSQLNSTNEQCQIFFLNVFLDFFPCLYGVLFIMFF